MLRLLSGLFLFLCLPTGLYAQLADPATYQNNLTLTVGISHGYFKDLNFSPLSYRSAGPRVGLAYARRTTAGHRWSMELGVSLTTLKNPANFRIDPDRYRIDVAFGYLHALSSNDDERRLHFGGKYRSYVDLTLYDGEEAVTFFALHGFEVAGAGDWKTGDRHRIKAAASVPVFGLLSRPPYTGWDKFIIDNAKSIPKIVTRGEWLPLGAFTALRANLGWEYRISDRFTVEARYGLAYYATKRLDHFRSLDNDFSVNLIYR